MAMPRRRNLLGHLRSQSLRLDAETERELRNVERAPVRQDIVVVTPEEAKRRRRRLRQNFYAGPAPVNDPVPTANLYLWVCNNVLFPFPAEDRQTALVRRTVSGWQLVSKPTEPGVKEAYIGDFLITSGGVFLMCTFGVVADVAAGIFRSTDGGESWSHVFDSGVTSLDEAEDGSLWASSQDGGPRFLRSDDDGASWAEVGSETVANAPHSISALNASTAYIYTNRPRILDLSGNETDLWDYDEENASSFPFQLGMNSARGGVFNNDGVFLSIWQGDWFPNAGDFEYRLRMYDLAGSQKFAATLTGMSGLFFWPGPRFARSRQPLFLSYGDDPGIAHVYRSDDAGTAWSELPSPGAGGDGAPVLIHYFGGRLWAVTSMHSGTGFEVLSLGEGESEWRNDLANLQEVTEFSELGPAGESEVMAVRETHAETP